MILLARGLVSWLVYQLGIPFVKEQSSEHCLQSEKMEQIKWFVFISVASATTFEIHNSPFHLRFGVYPKKGYPRAYPSPIEMCWSEATTSPTATPVLYQMFVPKDKLATVM